MRKILAILVSLLIKISCHNNPKIEYKMDNEELITFLYENIEVVDFEEHREEMILLDLEYNQLIYDIKIKYQDDKELGIKLRLIEQKKKDFYEYAIKIVKKDYKKYNYVDGPYFDYLVDKKDKEIQYIMLNIISDDKISDDLKKDILQKLNNLNIFEISDPDGYTNVRKEKSTSSDILQRIKSGEVVEVLDNSGDWYLIKTKEGKEGYVHKSRVKVSNEKPMSSNIDKKISQFFIEEQELKPSKSFIDKLLG